MTIKPTTLTKTSNFMQKSWAWLKAVDESVHYDPNEQLYQRIAQLEARLGERGD
jgi:hypothetical protein